MISNKDTLQGNDILKVNNNGDKVRIHADASELRVVYIGLAVGGVLLVIGIVSHFLAVGLWKLLICSGLGAVLAALGTRAKVEYRWLTITGAGAVALIFYVLVHHYSTNRITRGFIYGNLGSDTQISIEDDERILGALKLGPGYKYYEFIIEGSEMNRGVLTVSINYDVSYIPRERIDPFIQREQVIEWRYDVNQRGRIYQGDELITGVKWTDSPQE